MPRHLSTANRTPVRISATAPGVLTDEQLSLVARRIIFYFPRFGVPNIGGRHVDRTSIKAQ